MKTYFELLAENQLLKQKINELTKPKLVECNMFDKETVIENCTVQILENTVTGECSVGWWRNDT